MTTKKTIYLEGDEAIINGILQLAKHELGKGINAIDLTPCIPTYEVINQLNKIIMSYDDYEEQLNDYVEYLRGLNKND